MGVFLFCPDFSYPFYLRNLLYGLRRLFKGSFVRINFS